MKGRFRSSLSSLEPCIQFDTSVLSRSIPYSTMNWVEMNLDNMDHLQKSVLWSRIVTNHTTSSLNVWGWGGSPWWGRRPPWQNIQSLTLSTTGCRANSQANGPPFLKSDALAANPFCFCLRHLEGNISEFRSGRKTHRYPSFHAILCSFFCGFGFYLPTY